MDEAVIKYYRRLLKSGFESAGSFQKPSIFLDSAGEGVRLCGRPAGYMRIYVNVSDGKIDSIKYLCNCDPTTNVAVEILCELAKGRTLEEVGELTEGSFFQVLGSRSDAIGKKSKSLLELLDLGFARYRSGSGSSSASSANA